MKNSNNREENFKALAKNSWFKTHFKKLTAEDIGLCLDFIRDNEALDNNKFEEAVNRWFLDKPKPLKWTLLMELVSASKVELK